MVGNQANQVCQNMDYLQDCVILERTKKIKNFKTIDRHNPIGICRDGKTLPIDDIPRMTE